MLTWKLFVTIMSMVSLTLQMDHLDAGPSSSLSPFWVHDPESGSYYPSSLNLYNPFQPGLNAHKCFAIIRLYCRTQNDEVTSEDCAKKGILFYRVIQTDIIRRNPRDPMSWLDNFFDNFPLNRGEIELPEEFCSKQKAPPNITKDVSQREIEGFPHLYKASTCIDDLKEYKAQVHPPLNESQESVEFAKIQSRTAISWFALQSKVTLGLHKQRDSPTDINLEYSNMFPLKYPPCLEKVEDLLETDPAFKTNLAKRLKSFRDVVVDSFIKSCLQNLITYELGTRISLTGRMPSKSIGSKIAMNKTHLFKLIIAIATIQMFVKVVLLYFLNAKLTRVQVAGSLIIALRKLKKNLNDFLFVHV